LPTANESPRTVDTYGEAARQFLAFLVDAGMPTDVDRMKREHIEAFVEHLLATRMPATESTSSSVRCRPPTSRGGRTLRSSGSWRAPEHEADEAAP
jgi:hypothetical protein